MSSALTSLHLRHSTSAKFVEPSMLLAYYRSRQPGLALTYSSDEETFSYILYGVGLDY